MYLFLVSFGKVRGSPPSIRQFEWWITLLTVRYDQTFVPFCKWNVASNTWQMKIWRSKVIPNVWFIHQKMPGKVQVCIYLVQVRDTDSSVFYVVSSCLLRYNCCERSCCIHCPAMFIITVLLGAVTLVICVCFAPSAREKAGCFDENAILVDPFGIWNEHFVANLPNFSTSVTNTCNSKQNRVWLQSNNPP